MEKEIYPELKFTPWNIILLTKDEHEAKTNGFPGEKHKRLIERAKERYDREKESIKMDNGGE